MKDEKYYSCAHLIGEFPECFMEKLPKHIIYDEFCNLMAFSCSDDCTAKILKTSKHRGRRIVKHLFEFEPPDRDVPFKEWCEGTEKIVQETMVIKQ